MQQNQKRVNLRGQQQDFCADENSCNYSNKLKVASILWKEVRNSRNEKIYSKNLLTEYAYKIK